jgi:hypothetical protein
MLQWVILQGEQHGRCCINSESKNAVTCRFTCGLLVGFALREFWAGPTFVLLGDEVATLAGVVFPVTTHKNNCDCVYHHDTYSTRITRYKQEDVCVCVCVRIWRVHVTIGTSVPLMVAGF